MKKGPFTLLILLSFLSCQQDISEKNAKILSVKESKPDIAKTVEKFRTEKSSFREMVNQMKQYGYYALFLDEWSIAYKNHISIDCKTTDSIFIELPDTINWLASRRINDNESEIVTFDSAIAIEVVLKQKTKSPLKHDIKIVQLIFESNEMAQAAIPKMKKVSAYTIHAKGLKSPNSYWIHENTIYFVRVRAAAFSTKPFVKVFKSKYGEIELLRW